MTDADRLADLLLEWEERKEQGIDLSAEELCRDYPHLISFLARRIHALKVTSWLVDNDTQDEPANAVDSAQSSSPLLGERYRLEGKIGEGGFAEVWKGYDLELRRIVAIKRPRQTKLIFANRIDQFLAEARRVAGLKHPGVVPVFDVGRDKDDVFIVSEFIEGGSLADRQTKNPLLLQETVRVVAEVAETLAYAHQQGFLHRDIKPANILIDHHGRALLADFGISCSFDEKAEPTSFGTLAYMSPEQLEGKATDQRADIYSLGVVLYELLFHEQPYKACDPVELRREVLNHTQPTIVSRKGIPDRLANICFKCLSRLPVNRYCNASDLAADLRNVALNAPNLPKRFALGVAIFLLLLSGIGLWQGWRQKAQPLLQANQKLEPKQWRMVGVLGGRDQLSGPVGIAWDKSGNLLVASSGSGQIVAFDGQTGQCLGSFTKPNQEKYQLHHPHYLCITQSGNVVVSDNGGHRLLIFRPDGSWLKSFGGRGHELGQFHYPKGIACGLSDTIYVVDSSNHRIQVFDAEGKRLGHFGKLGSDPGEFRNPTGICVSDDGTVYIGDTDNGRIQAFDSTGQFLRILEGSKIEVQGVTAQKLGGLFATDTFNKSIRKFTSVNDASTQLPAPKTNDFHPLGVAIGPDGIVAVTNYSQHKVYFFRQVEAENTTAQPSSLIEIMALGRLYLDEEQWSKAEATFTEAVRHNPHNAEAYFWQGISQLNAGRLTDSLTTFNVAVRLEPNTSAIYLQRGIAFLKLLHVEEALADLKHALNLSPLNPVAYRKMLSRAYVCRAVEFGKSKRWFEAVNDMDEAINLDSQDGDYFDKRGTFQLNRQEFAKALDDFNEAIRLDPNQTLYYLHRGRVYEVLGKKTEAAKDFSVAQQMK